MSNTLPKLDFTILLYNGFPFHHEMTGCILDFSAKYNINVSIVLKYIDTSWLDVYRSKYEFNVLESLPSDLDQYLFVMLLTDDDYSFPEYRINENVVCIDHYYVNRRGSIRYHLPVIPFKDNENIGLYIFPVFNYIDYNTKMNTLNLQKKPVISIIGSSGMPSDLNQLYMIENLDEFNIFIINRKIPQLFARKLPNVYLCENISAVHMFEILVSSTYVLFIHNNTPFSTAQMDNKCMTGCMPISFSTGCKLIIPKELNRLLKLNSSIEYSSGSKLILDKTPSLVDVFNERDCLASIRDKSILDLDHMKPYLEFKAAF